MRLNRLATLLLPVLLLGSACSEDQPTATPTPEASQGAETSDPSPTAPGAKASPKAISADAVPEGTVTATYPGPAGGGSSVRLQALPIEVRGGLATLTVLWTPTFPLEKAGESISLYDINSNRPVYVALVDPVNLKRHNVVKDSQGKDLSTDEVGTGSVSGSPVASRYTFAAPPTGVTSMDAYVGGFPPMADVPVQR